MLHTTEYTQMLLMKKINENRYEGGHLILAREFGTRLIDLEENELVTEGQWVLRNVQGEAFDVDPFRTAIAKDHGLDLEL